MSTRQSIERQQIQHERREADRERTMTRRYDRCAKHIKATGSVTKAGHIRNVGE